MEDELNKAYRHSTITELHTSHNMHVYTIVYLREKNAFLKKKKSLVFHYINFHKSEPQRNPDRIANISPQQF